VSEPRKHHYVPVCYLKQWANTDDRRLCEHKLIPGGYGVKPRRTSPDGSGYQLDLYRIEGVPDDIAQDFEKRFCTWSIPMAPGRWKGSSPEKRTTGPVLYGAAGHVSSSRCCFAIPRW
jgi:hypothetical protein